MPDDAGGYHMLARLTEASLALSDGPKLIIDNSGMAMRTAVSDLLVSYLFNCIE